MSDLKRFKKIQKLLRSGFCPDKGICARRPNLKNIKSLRIYQVLILVTSLDSNSLRIIIISVANEREPQWFASASNVKTSCDISFLRVDFATFSKKNRPDVD